MAAVNRLSRSHQLPNPAGLPPAEARRALVAMLEAVAAHVDDDAFFALPDEGQEVVQEYIACLLSDDKCAWALPGRDGFALVRRALQQGLQRVSGAPPASRLPAHYQGQPAGQGGAGEGAAPDNPDQQQQQQQQQGEGEQQGGARTPLDTMIETSLMWLRMRARHLGGLWLHEEVQDEEALLRKPEALGGVTSLALSCVLWRVLHAWLRTADTRQGRKQLSDALEGFGGFNGAVGRLVQRLNSLSTLEQMAAHRLLHKLCQLGQQVAHLKPALTQQLLPHVAEAITAPADSPEELPVHTGQVFLLQLVSQHLLGPQGQEEQLVRLWRHLLRPEQQAGFEMSPGIWAQLVAQLVPLSAVQEAGAAAQLRPVIEHVATMPSAWQQQEVLTLLARVGKQRVVAESLRVGSVMAALAACLSSSDSDVAGKAVQACAKLLCPTKTAVAGVEELATPILPCLEDLSTAAERPAELQAPAVELLGKLKGALGQDAGDEAAGQAGTGAGAAGTSRAAAAGPVTRARSRHRQADTAAAGATAEEEQQEAAALAGAGSSRGAADAGRVTRRMTRSSHRRAADATAAHAEHQNEP